MSKRNSITYGKRDRRSSVRATKSFQQTEDKFAAFLESEDVAFPPTKKQHLTSTSLSQHEAIMAEPTEDQIALVTGVAYCDRDTAIKYLKAKNNNVDQAVAAVFDQEDVSAGNKVELPTAWDESVWAAGREGGESEQTLRPLGSSTAPTRGPSPVGSFRHPGSKEQEDADVAAALAASAHDISYGAQETGVVRPDGTTIPAYGPHPQSRYQDPNQWALVKVTPTTEMVPDVDPADRRYIPNEPRFLKSPVHGDYLSSLLTICHSIPAARELFLIPDYERFDYGNDAEWWKGHAIPLPQIVHTADGSPTNPQLARYDDFMAETQRLMAFLDSSDRAYATTVALEQSQGLSMHGQSAQASQKTNANTFIQELAAAYRTLGRQDDVVEKFFGVRAGSEGGDIDNEIFEVFHLDVDTTDGSRDLLQILDDLLWNIEDDDDLEDRYLERLPQVWVMRLKQTGTAGSLKVTAPASLYMDKYMKENVEEVKPFRERIAYEKRRISKITAVEKQLRTWKTNNGLSIDAQKLLRHAKSQFIQEDTVAPLINGLSETTIDSESVAAKLDAIIENIDTKLNILSEERLKTQKVLSDLSTRTSPEFAATHSDHKYTLVGISTKPNITYVLRPQEATEMLIDSREEGDDTPAGMQWWRIEYTTNGSKASINRNKVAAYEALPAIEHEHHTAFLIYASDAALDRTQVQPLNEGLQKFIQVDNEFFQQELRDHPPPSYPLDFSMDDVGDARQSIERRESFDSVRAQGSEDHEFSAQDPTQHASYGLGYGAGEYDPPVAEIPPPDETYHSEMSDIHTEKVENDIV